MTKLILHGELGKQFGRQYDLQIGSPVEGIRALSALKPGFAQAFSKGNYYVYTSNGKDRVNLDETTFALKTHHTINIVPAVAGAKKKGVGKLLTGIALIGVAFIPGLNAAVFGAVGGLAGSVGGTAGTLAAKMVANVAARALFMGGLTMAMGGAAQLMAPKVAEAKESNLFSGTPDSVQEGTPVPLVYGDYLAVGYPVSFELTNGLNTYSGRGTTSVGGGGNGSGSGGTTGGWSVLDRLRENSA